MISVNQYIETRNGGYYVAGTRIGLDVIAHEFQDGRSAEAIFDAYPSIGSLPKSTARLRSYWSTRPRSKTISRNRIAATSRSRPVILFRRK
jgi:hypothetical protein